jgi:uncharacterized protein YecE (DUF72 family)
VPGDEQQLSLFAAESEPTPTSVDAEVSELAAALPEQLYFGCCSWTFTGWKGEVYHRHYRSQKDFVGRALNEYSSYPLFGSAEIDSSYYRPLRARDFDTYAEHLPEGFLCGMKVWQEISIFSFPNHARWKERANTVNPHFLDPEAFSEQVMDAVSSSFSEHIGPVIISIPPAGRMADPGAFEKRLSHFLARAPSGFRYAFELRDRHLFTRRYLAVLADHNASHVYNYWSRMPSLAQQLALSEGLSGPAVVVRLMLPPGRNYGAQKDAFEPFDKIVAPQQEMRDDVCQLIREACERGFPIFVYVNNKAEGSAPLTIRAIARQLVHG